MIDPANIDSLVETLSPWVTETLWIGKMNKIRLRCQDVDEPVLAALEEAYSDENIMDLVERYDTDPRISWKDSIKKVIERHS